MKPVKNNERQCVNSLQAFKKYVKTYRQIVLVENEDSKFLHR